MGCETRPSKVQAPKERDGLDIMIINTAKGHYQQSEKTVEGMFENHRRANYSEYHPKSMMTEFMMAIY